MESRSIYKVTIDKPTPQILIATEPRLRTWLGAGLFNMLMRAGKVERIEQVEYEPMEVTQ
jgi:hypothetical protein